MNRLNEMFSKVCKLPLINESVTIPFVRNTKSLGKFKNDLYAQNIEPHGTYMSHSSTPLPDGLKAQGWIQGSITFDNPLVLEFKSTGPTGWKKDLVDTYKKKGRALSLALIKQGYDGIITKDGDIIMEIVSFKDFR